MRKILGIMLIMGLMMVLAAPALFAQEDAFGGIMNMTYPTIAEAKIDPASPAADQAAKVSAKVAISSDEDGATIASVKAGYTVNGGEIKYVDMAASGDVYSGTIPGQPAGSKVDVFITASSSQGNVAITALPGGKLVPGAGDVDNEVDIVPDDLDLLGAAMGFDGTALILKYSVQGTVNGGTLDPPFVHLYGIKITNPDTDEGEGLMVGKLCAFLPLLVTEADRRKQFSDMLGVKLPENGAACLDIAKLIQQDRTGYLEKAVIDSKVDGASHTLKVAVGELGDNPGGMMRIIFATIANAGIESFAPIPMNCSGFTQFYYKTTLGFTTPAAAKPAPVAVKPEPAAAAPVIMPPSAGPGLRRFPNTLNWPTVW